MAYKRAGIIVAVIIMVIAVTCYKINKAINAIGPETVDGPVVVAVAKPAPKDKVVAPQKEVKTVIQMSDVDELAKYGITITPRLSGPSTPKEWEDYIEENLEKSPVFESPQGQEMIGIMKVSEEEYEQKMKDIEEHVRIVEERVNQDTFNRKNREQLQNIYKLRAIGKVLKKKVVASDTSLD